MMTVFIGHLASLCLAEGYDVILQRPDPKLGDKKITVRVVKLVDGHRVTSRMDVVERMISHHKGSIEQLAIDMLTQFNRSIEYEVRRSTGGNRPTLKTVQDARLLVEHLGNGLQNRSDPSES